jgi:hypothetical protein
MSPRKARAPKRNASLPASGFVSEFANDLVSDRANETEREYPGSPFPDEEAESVDALRPVIPTAPIAAEPERVSNGERVARQREAFGAAPAPAARTAPRPAPRRITAELVKAETLLVRLERRRQDSLAHAETVWAGKRLALIKSFPEDVSAALHAMNVLGDADFEELEGLESEG